MIYLGRKSTERKEAFERKSNQATESESSDEDKVGQEAKDP